MRGCVSSTSKPSSGSLRNSSCSCKYDVAGFGVLYGSCVDGQIFHEYSAHAARVPTIASTTAIIIAATTAPAVATIAMRISLK